MTPSNNKHETPLPGTANGNENDGKTSSGSVPDNVEVPDAAPTETTPAEAPELDPESSPAVTDPTRNHG